MRDEALQLLRERFNEDLQSAAQILGGRKAEALATEAVYANKLATEYLAESERLFALMNRILPNGFLTRGESESQKTSKRTSPAPR